MSAPNEERPVAGDAKADRTGERETPAPATGRTLTDDLPGETLAEKLDALHDRHFAGTALTMHTTLWNMVHAFKEDVKTLLPPRP